MTKMSLAQSPEFHYDFLFMSMTMISDLVTQYDNDLIYDSEL